MKLRIGERIADETSELEVIAYAIDTPREHGILKRKTAR